MSRSSQMESVQARLRAEQANRDQINLDSQVSSALSLCTPESLAPVSDGKYIASPAKYDNMISSLRPDVVHTFTLPVSVYSRQDKTTHNVQVTYDTSKSARRGGIEVSLVPLHHSSSMRLSHAPSDAMTLKLSKIHKHLVQQKQLAEELQGQITSLAEDSGMLHGVFEESRAVVTSKGDGYKIVRLHRAVILPTEATSSSCRVTAYFRIEGEGKEAMCKAIATEIDTPTHRKGIYRPLSFQNSKSNLEFSRVATIDKETGRKLAAAIENKLSS